MNDLLKTTIFVGVGMALAGLAFFTTRDSQPASAADFDDQGQPFFADFKDALGVHRPGSRRLRFLDGHGVAVSRDVQGQQVGDSVALQLSSRCA